MSQQQNELTAPFSGQFTGLDLSSAVGNIPPNGSSVFHNCDVSADGSVVRRGGTQTIATIDTVTANRPVWASSVRTRNNSSYTVLVTDGGITVSLMRDSVFEQTPRIVGGVTKGGVWSAPLSSVCFISVTSPFDRLLLLTPEHPIVQLSFLERTFKVACSASSGTTGTFSSPSSPNDSTLWNDTNVSSYIVTNDVTGTTHAMTAKSPGFTFTLSGTFTVGVTYTLTVRQITWQWWAEALYWEGADISQTVSRVNVTDADQNVRVPSRLITDLEPIYRNSQEMGLRLYSTSVYTASAYAMNPTDSPNGENQWGFSDGGRYIFSANNKLSASPFFATFGAKQAAGGVGQVSFIRLRDLRFNGGSGIQPVNLDVTVGDSTYAWNATYSLPNGYQTGWYSVNGTDRLFNAATTNTTNSTCILFYQPGVTLPFSTPVNITNTGSATLFGASAQRLWYRAVPAGGGTLDGCYVRAYGIGAYVDYSKRSFHSNGILYRGRLILQNPQTARDQLLCSEVNDESVPGEFYQYFQITDALDGATSNPFTLNVTSDGRERITALVGWQQTVFAFTNSNTYSIGGGEQFSEGNYAVNLVSTYGAFNANCVLVTNLTVLYMNRFGLFDLLNKPNTDSYGAVERSAKVRKLFNEDVVSAAFDGIHWLQYNEATNRVYIGLGVLTDTVYTSRNLVLNVSWEAWSTIGSVVPFRMLQGVQVFSYTLLVAEIVGGRYYVLLCADMPYYLDFSYYVPFTAFPIPLSIPIITETYTADSRGIVNLATPVTPGITDYQVANSGKMATSYVRLDGTATDTQVLTRNPMRDYPETLALCGGLTIATPYATVSLDSPFTVYCSASFTGTTPTTVNLVDGKSFTSQLTVTSPNTQQLCGVCYPSVYASPTFDLDALGRLKRLKRLHLLFDTTVTRKTLYPFTPTIRIINAAFVNVLSNYRDDTSAVELSLVGDSILFDDTTLDIPVETRGVLQQSIALQGYGCDYQFYVTSVGAEAFKLSAYEFEVQAAQYKRYTRP